MLLRPTLMLETNNSIRIRRGQGRRSQPRHLSLTKKRSTRVRRRSTFSVKMVIINKAASRIQEAVRVVSRAPTLRASSQSPSATQAIYDQDRLKEANRLLRQQRQPLCLHRNREDKIQLVRRSFRVTIKPLNSNPSAWLASLKLQRQLNSVDVKEPRP